MNSFKVDTPPTLRGSAETQISQLQSYLYQLPEMLNMYMSAADGSGGGRTSLLSKNTGGIAYKGTEDSVAKDINALRSMIVNTAQVVSVEMTKLETTLTEKYMAQSEAFGDFSENIETTITATARDVLQRFGYDSTIATLKEDTAGLKEYRLTTEGFIKQGFIDYDEYGLPIIGIAIGQDLSSVKEIIGGVEYEHLDRAQNCAFYTADRVSFRINGREAAYLSNQKLYIVDAQVVGSLSLGDGWEITATAANGVQFKYVGGG